MKRVLHDLIALWLRLTTAGRRRRLARDLDDELAFHVAMREAEFAAPARSTVTPARRPAADSEI